MNSIKVARHRAPLPGVLDASSFARRTVDRARAVVAVGVLAATDELPESRDLYRELLAKGALMPQAQPSIPAADLIAVLHADAA